MGDRAVSAADYPRQSNLPISIARGQSFEVDTRALRYDGWIFT